MKKIDNITENKICDLYTDGYNGVKISKILNKNLKTIYKILKLNNLTKSPSAAKIIYQFDDIYFDKITTPQQAYWLGFISGDGSINKRSLILNLSIKDKIILDQFKIHLKSNHIIHTYGNFVNLTIISEKFTNALRSYGIKENKTKLLSLNNNIPKKLLNNYILGLIDADGCFSIDKKRGLRFSLVGIENFLFEIQNILINECFVNKNKLQKHHSTEYIKYLVYSGDNQLKKIVNYLYKDKDKLFYLPRKYNIVKNYFNL